MSVSESLPILCIHGSEDQHMIAANHEKFMKSNFGNVEYHTIPGVGHTTFWEEPEKINALILAWIKKFSQVSASDDVHILVV
jgi:pimeloyl-ACP methyl ester carboxylesterase